METRFRVERAFADKRGFPAVTMRIAMEPAVQPSGEARTTYSKLCATGCGDTVLLQKATAK